MGKLYYVQSPNGERKGPYTLDQLKSMWGNGLITADNFAEDADGNRSQIPDLLNNRNIFLSPATEGKIKKGSKNSCLGCLGVIVLFIIASAILSPKPTPPPVLNAEQQEAKRIEDEKAKAESDLQALKDGLLIDAREYVKERLKAPSTAKFSGNFYPEEVIGKDSKTGQWAVYGYVDSQNGFGAMIRTRYLVKFKESDGKQVPISVKFIGQ